MEFQFPSKAKLHNKRITDVPAVVLVLLVIGVALLNHFPRFDPRGGSTG
jgi:hypothetical protein